MESDNLEKQINLLTDPDRMKRSQAALRVGRSAMHGQLNRRALKLLTNLLRDIDREVRMNSAFAIGEYASHGIFDVDALGWLIKLLRDWSSKVRCRATTAIGEYAKLGLYSKRVIKPLIRFLTDDDKELRANAGWTLGIYALRDILEKGNSKLIEKILKTRDPNVNVGLAIAVGDCAWENGRMKGKALETFVKLLSHKDLRIREGTAFVLGENAENNLTDERILSPLFDLLSDDNPTVRAYAIFALGAYARRGVKRKHVVQKLLAATRNSEDDVRETLKNILFRLELDGLQSTHSNSRIR